MTDSKYPPIEDQGSRIIVRGDLGEALITGDVSPQPGLAEFRELFDIDPADYLGDPTDDFYQGIFFTQIITRKSDGAKFGYTYWFSPGHDHMELTYEQDLKELGVEVEYDEDCMPMGGVPYVFLPAIPFQRQGYTLKRD